MHIVGHGPRVRGMPAWVFPSPTSWAHGHIVPDKLLEPRGVRESGGGPTPSSLGKRWLHEAHQNGISGGSWESFQPTTIATFPRSQEKSHLDYALYELDKMASASSDAVPGAAVVGASGRLRLGGSGALGEKKGAG